jgi:predicted short-subunit dehydrogenase-like oxidoreductase (DUF2520 family)
LTSSPSAARIQRAERAKERSLQRELGVKAFIFPQLSSLQLETGNWKLETLKQPTITIVGPGNLGSAMARALRAAGYRISEIVYRSGRTAARALACEVGARAVVLDAARLSADLIWICAGDSAIAAAAVQLARHGRWKGKIALHSSGALTSRELEPLRERGADVASLHPMMTFVRRVRPELSGVTFAAEGDARALRAARRIARDLGGRFLVIDPQSKPLYHAFGAFASPLIIAALAQAERVANGAGIKSAAARQAIAPILAQTIRNYLARGPAGAFSGPLVRGDLQTVRRHLEVLRAIPDARAAYVALAHSALRTLPVRNKRRIAALLRGK